MKSFSVHRDSRWPTPPGPAIGYKGLNWGWLAGGWGLFSC